jgi:hypothetical protein
MPTHSARRDAFFTLAFAAFFAALLAPPAEAFFAMTFLLNR